MYSKAKAWKIFKIILKYASEPTPFLFIKNPVQMPMEFGPGMKEDVISGEYFEVVNVQLTIRLVSRGGDCFIIWITWTWQSQEWLYVETDQSGGRQEASQCFPNQISIVVMLLDTCKWPRNGLIWSQFEGLKNGRLIYVVVSTTWEVVEPEELKWRASSSVISLKWWRKQLHVTTEVWFCWHSQCRLCF